MPLFYDMKFCLLILKAISTIAAIENCPTGIIRSIVIRATETTKDPAIQMRMVRRIIEDVYGGSWGVLIIRNPELVSNEVHWTIPEHNNVDGSPGFCLSVIKGWQYNVFKTGSKDYHNRVTVSSVIERLRLAAAKPKPKRMTVKEFDQLLARELETGTAR